MNEGEATTFINVKYGLWACQHFGNVNCRLLFVARDEKNSDVFTGHVHLYVSKCLCTIHHFRECFPSTIHWVSYFQSAWKSNTYMRKLDMELYVVDANRWIKGQAKEFIIISPKWPSWRRLYTVLKDQRLQSLSRETCYAMKVLCNLWGDSYLMKRVSILQW